VLDQLKKATVKATFFCVGKNVSANPGIFDRLIREGHSVGNHTMNHIKGWETSTEKYLLEVEECNKLVKSRLFRPPYGRISFRQFFMLRKKYRIVFWDVLSVDYDAKVSPQQCISNVLDNIRTGSVIVFHDSLKAQRNLQIALPLILKKVREYGFDFEVLT
jgi:peptidoglycan/xylan/chitin deacetylase (PgdA/CDA1 family)